jgi:hypothetical protein
MTRLYPKKGVSSLTPAPAGTVRHNRPGRRLPRYRPGSDAAPTRGRPAKGRSCYTPRPGHPTRQWRPHLTTQDGTFGGHFMAPQSAGLIALTFRGQARVGFCRGSSIPRCGHQSALAGITARSTGVSIPASISRSGRRPGAVMDRCPNTAGIKRPQAKEWRSSKKRLWSD